MEKDLIDLRKLSPKLAVAESHGIMPLKHTEPSCPCKAQELVISYTSKNGHEGRVENKNTC